MGYAMVDAKNQKLAALVGLIVIAGFGAYIYLNYLESASLSAFPLDKPLYNGTFSAVIANVLESNQGTYGYSIVGAGTAPPAHTFSIFITVLRFPNCTIVVSYGSTVEKDTGTVIYNYSLIKKPSGIYFCGETEYPHYSPANPDIVPCSQPIALADGINSLYSTLIDGTFVAYEGQSNGIIFYDRVGVNQSQYSIGSRRCAS